MIPKVSLGRPPASVKIDAMRKPHHALCTTTQRCTSLYVLLLLSAKGLYKMNH